LYEKNILDIDKIKEASRISQESFVKEFEINYPIVTEFLSTKIEDQAKLARTNISIYIKDILKQFPIKEDVDEKEIIDEVIKYLKFKGFYVEKNNEILGASRGKIKEIKPFLKISWY
jgi:hypothetical protein